MRASFWSSRIGLDEAGQLEFTLLDEVEKLVEELGGEEGESPATAWKR